LFFLLPAPACAGRTIVQVTTKQEHGHLLGGLLLEQLFASLPEKTGSGFPDPVPNN